MNESVEKFLGRLAGAMVEFSARRPWLVVAISTLLTAGSIYVAVAILEVNPDSDALLSPDLPIRQTNLALEAAFPDLHRNLVVMIEADDPDDTRDAAEELADILAADPQRYPGVFLPGDDPFYEDFGLFYLEMEELDDLSDRIGEAGQLLSTIADRPELPILLAAFTRVIESVEGLPSLEEDGVRVLEAVARAVEAANTDEHETVLWDDLLFDDLGGDPDDPQLLFVRPSGDLTQMPPVLEALADIRATAKELTPRPGLRVRVTGDRAVHSEEMSLILVEALVAGAASLVLVALVLLLSLRSPRLMAATVITLIAGLTWTAGLAGLTVGGLNALTSAFAVLYIGLAVDFGIHFALGFLERRRLGQAPQEAIRNTGARVGSSLFFCAVTTTIGFYAFIPTSYAGVRDMGIISGTGVLLGLFSTLTLYPALISLGLGASKRAVERGRFELRPPSFPARYPKLVCGLAAIVTLGCSSALAWVRFDVNPINVRDPRVESVQALKDLLLDSERSVWTIEVLTDDLEEAREVAERVETLPDIDHVNTPLSFLPEEQPERLEIFEQLRVDLTTPYDLGDDETGDDSEDRLTALEYTVEGYGVALDIDAELRGDEGDGDPSLVAAERLRTALLSFLDRVLGDGDIASLQALETDVFSELPSTLDDVIDALPEREVGLEDLPRDLLDRYIARDGRVRVEIFSSTDLRADGALERFTDLILSVRSDAGGPAAGTVGLAREMVGALRQALITAVIVIAILLMALWRSPKYMLITLTPLLIGSVTTAAVTVFTGISFNFANIIVLPLVLGIGVDSGIHLVHRFRAGAEPADLLGTSTARAVLFSALTTVFSFATLALSNHLGLSSLAQLLAVGVILMLAANIIVLPAILTLVSRE